MRRYFKFVLLLMIVGILVGCDTVYCSRIFIRTIPSLHTADIESTIRDFSLHHGYAITESDKNDPWVKQEIAGEKPIIWIAKNKYQPTILFTSMKDMAVVRLIQLSGTFRPNTHRNYTEELYSLLKNKFGAGNVDLLESP